MRLGQKIGGFFKRIGKGIASGAKKTYHFVKDKAVPFIKNKAAPAVSKVAGVVSKVASLIPHPAAQGVAIGAATTKHIADKVSGSGS